MTLAKIIATLGPKVAGAPAIGSLVQAGVRCFRLNLSYDDAQTHKALVQAVRQVEVGLGQPLCLIVDLTGPRFRIGAFSDGTIPLEVGQLFKLDQDEAPGDATRVHLPVPEAFAAASIGDLLRLDDGRVILRVRAVTPFALSCTVVAGSALSSHKIIALPRTAPRRDHLSNGDRTQILWARDMGIDWISATWPSHSHIWQEIRGRAGPMRQLAKMDSSASLQKFDQALEMADGLVVARGDLGYDLPPEEIPGWQKRLVRAARQAGKPVVIAAQMLESMVTNPSPTRAESSDVANAVRDGADALMLSAETAIGVYPGESVTLMKSVIDSTEANQPAAQAAASDRDHPSIADCIARAAALAADELSAPLIFCFTSSGSTALSVARTRPRTKIICASDSPQTLRQMQLVWGLRCIAAPALTAWRDVVDTAVKLAKELKVPSGQPLVITAGMPFGTAGSTNILRIATAA